MVVYYLVVVIIGIFIVLNLFLAILLADFDAGDPPDFRYWVRVRLMMYMRSRTPGYSLL